MEQKILQILNSSSMHELTADELTKLFTCFWNWTMIHCEIVTTLDVKAWRYIAEDGSVMLCADSKQLFEFYLNNIYNGRK